MLNASEDAVRLVEVTPLEGDGHVTEGLQSEIGGEGEREDRGEGKGKGGVRVRVRGGVRVREVCEGWNEGKGSVRVRVRVR